MKLSVRLSQKPSSSSEACGEGLFSVVGLWNLVPICLILISPFRSSYHNSLPRRVLGEKKAKLRVLQAEILIVHPLIKISPGCLGVNGAEWVCTDCAGKIKDDAGISSGVPSVLAVSHITYIEAMPKGESHNF